MSSDDIIAKQIKLLEIVSARLPKIVGTPTLSESQEIRKSQALLIHTAEQLGIDLSIAQSDASSMTTLYTDIQIELEKMRINIELAGVPHEQRGLALDESWRSRVHAYLFHIRQVLEAETGIDIRLRESIL